MALIFQQQDGRMEGQSRVPGKPRDTAHFPPSRPPPPYFPSRFSRTLTRFFPCNNSMLLRRGHYFNHV
ncbi:hypothetical protein [Herbaspirillum sp. LeCh32-8]|uniref:hypothetical protein n=1 Tax=Herbaspirillum sp. LeCh32-8 TaxID=2821356 RepID=UPI001AE97688|nr:hypothetical protein [Herbaspirillum sp. LeCh32-8]